MLCICLIAAAVLMTISAPSVAAQNCKKATASSNYPKQATSNETIQVITTITGSCSMGSEDFLAVRVDITDPATKLPLSMESASVGYSVANFSVTVQNYVLAPAGNQTWQIEIDSYLYIDSQQSRVNSTTAMIQVSSNSTPVPEFHTDRSLVLLLALTATLTLYGRKPHKTQNL